MCGIYVSVCRGKALEPVSTTRATLQARGPDAFQTLKISVPPHDASTTHRVLTFCSSVLALRGDHVEEQPLIDSKSGSILCWNGEAWKYDGNEVSGNDSILVFRLLLIAASSDAPAVSISKTLTTISGPFAFVFYDANTSSIYYGRDRLGRRSLLTAREGTESLIISSVSPSNLHATEEVSTNYLHCLALLEGRYQEQQIPWAMPLPCINTALPPNSTSPAPSDRTTTSLLSRLRESLKLRVSSIPDHDKLHAESGAAKIAILFSGGLDCTLLARIVHDILPLDESIDLLNVAFENPRAMKNRMIQESAFEICPDRITGRASFAELVQTCPERCWRFVAIDIPYSESQTHKPTIIRLLKPHNTEMDLSIGMALYFAARGQGNAVVSAPDSIWTQLYATTARVLLSGLGADELFGGYSRHAKAFQRAGFQGLIEELHLDIGRIGDRNLGRDDRVISHWGKEARYPYLDEDLVAFTLTLPVWEKCGFRPARLIPKHYEEATRAEQVEDLDPSKMLLRILLWNLGMRSAAAERKRAMQFGAKTAKMELSSGSRRGTEIVEAS